jgi:hypothetical protein
MQNGSFQVPESQGIVEEGQSHLSIAERRQHREIHLPRRFDDFVPDNLQSLPPFDIPMTPTNSGREQTQTGSAKSDNSNILQSPQNSFGLFRRYHAHLFPSHDPDSELTMDDLCDITPSGSVLPYVPETIEQADLDYGPYPNRSSFLLGEWNWNDHVQKSKSSFKSLVNIIGDPDFQPSDIRDTHWDAIDQELGNSDIPDMDFEEVPHWIKNDARWTKTPIVISVPFHRYTESPGPRDYMVSDFYHRSIISILRESLSHPVESLHFHYEPYELYWKQSNDADPTRVFGELYTSPAFIDVHHSLQDLPPEPGCKLPRCVAGLMLSSDSTQLTSFGDAKIWPQYLYFGNHSKYRRCKPTSHLCHHVAYFHKVSIVLLLTLSVESHVTFEVTG